MDTTPRQPDFYRSCDIIDLSTSEESEGRQLARLFEEHAVRYAMHEAGDFDSFQSLVFSFAKIIALRNAAARKCGEPLYAPELHISCHGTPSGILWKDSTLIEWPVVRAALLSYARHLGWVLGPRDNGAFEQTSSMISLSLSCCYGSHAAQIFLEEEPYAVGGFCAPNRAINSHDCAEFFLRLYTMQIAGDPWNLPAKVNKLLEESPIRGPDGPVEIQCFTPRFTANPNYVPPAHFATLPSKGSAKGSNRNSGVR